MIDRDPESELPPELQWAAERGREALASLERMLDLDQLRPIAATANLIAERLMDGKKVLAFGNGGSAADAQHLVAELIGRFERDRAPYAAVSLVDNLSTVTAVGNDHGFEQVFARQVRALGSPGDIVVGISTSGNSPNVLLAVRTANELGMTTVGLTGGDGGGLRERVNHCLAVPAHSTAQIQELHTIVIHMICGIVERRLGHA